MFSQLHQYRVSASRSLHHQKTSKRGVASAIAPIPTKNRLLFITYWVLQLILLNVNAGNQETLLLTEDNIFLDVFFSMSHQNLYIKSTAALGRR